MAATFRDYEWVDGHELEDPLDAYCITLIQHHSVGEVIEALSGKPAGLVHGIDTLSERSFAEWASGVSEYLMGLCPLDGWTLMLEINGFIGVSHEAIGPLSAGSKIVSHFRNVNRYDDFRYWVDGSEVMRFEPHASGWADASPELLQEIDRAGFEITGLNPRRPVASAAFALAENLTGVRLTPSLLRGAVYSTALVAM